MEGEDVKACTRLAREKIAKEGTWEWRWGK